jgi:hypothetical protein
MRGPDCDTGACIAARGCRFSRLPNARGRRAAISRVGDCDQGRHILIAVARYLAAHSPTERAALQTADIARRLMLGSELHRTN